jgi:beta-phosphoglucomutase
MNYKAIIFDLDGVIINSEDIHAKAKKKTLQQFGITYPETIFNDFKGRPDLVFWKHVALNLAHGRYTVKELDDYKRVEYFNLIDQMELVPGAMEFIAIVRSRFDKMALVSSATLPDLSVSDKKFNIIRWFDIIQLGEDTLNHKPHPEPFEKALVKLGITGSEAIVIEDSPNGILSAKTAGCYVIGITTGFNIHDLLNAGADNVAGSFGEIAGIIEKVYPAG